MPEVVMVHGIAQSRKSADTLENEWLPALAGGVRLAGSAELADRIWRNQRPDDLDVRMAFYGDLFRSPGAQGDALPEPGGEGEEIEEQLAMAWLRAAAERAGDRTDQERAQRSLAGLTTSTGAQGAGAAGRVVINRLAQLKWFAPFGFGFAERFVRRSLREVSLYLSDRTIRAEAQQRVLRLVDEDTQIVIGHSLGSVVAYEALHRNPRPVTLITLGSPLALRTVIYDRLEPQPPTVPPQLAGWADFADRDDLIAVHTDITRDFPPATPAGIEGSPTITVDNGAHPHDAAAYLTEPRLGHTIIRNLHQ